MHAFYKRDRVYFMHACLSILPDGRLLKIISLVREPL